MPTLPESTANLLRRLVDDHQVLGGLDFAEVAEDRTHDCGRGGRLGGFGLCGLVGEGAGAGEAQQRGAAQAKRAAREAAGGGGQAWGQVVTSCSGDGRP